MERDPMTSIAVAPSSPLETLRILDRLQQAGMRAGGGLKKTLPVFEAHVHVFEAWQRIHQGDPVLWYAARGADAVSIRSFDQLQGLLANLTN